jgi:oligopeptidase A
MPSAARRSSSTSPSRACWKACSAWSRRCSAWPSAPTRARLARQRALLPRLARRRARGGVLPGPARAQRQAVRRLDGRQPRPLAPARRPGLQLPVAHLVCNFAPPVGDQPALLTHDDVITLFHEFGHGLHHMLTQVDELAVSGIAGVEGDAVELPSQFMENFCWEWEVLQRLTAHVDTGEPLPRACSTAWWRRATSRAACNAAPVRVRAVRHAAAREPGTAAHACRPWPTRSAPRSSPCRRRTSAATPTASRTSSTAVMRLATTATPGPRCCRPTPTRLRGSRRVRPRHRQRFRQHILEVGGSRPAMESFKAFRGREPQLDALLRHQGLGTLCG